MGTHMQSNLSFFKKSRQQLRTLAKDIMSRSDYATYINEESAWENQVDEHILSIKNILFSTNQNATSDMVHKIEEKQSVQSIVEEPSLTPTSKKVPSDEKEEHLSEGNDEITSQELFVNKQELENTNVEENITEKLVDNQIDTDDVGKNITEKTSEKPISIDAPKPFHVKIQNSNSKKRRRSIFRRRKKNKQEEIRTLAKEQSLHSFSDGIRNIISQVSNGKDIQKKESNTESSTSLEETQLEKISNYAEEHIDLFTEDGDVKNSTMQDFSEPVQLFHVNQESQRDDSLLFDVLEEKQDILDADSLELDLNVDMFHDLPPPIPEYFDTESTKEDSIEPDETFQQTSPEVNAQIEELHVIELNNDSSLSEKPKDIAYYTNQLLIERSTSKRVELFIGRLSIHLQKQNWLEGSSDAFMILVLDASQSKKVTSIIESYGLPTVYQDRIKSSFKF